MPDCDIEIRCFVSLGLYEPRLQQDRNGSAAPGTMSPILLLSMLSIFLLKTMIPKLPIFLKKKFKFYKGISKRFSVRGVQAPLSHAKSRLSDP